MFQPVYTLYFNYTSLLILIFPYLEAKEHLRLFEKLSEWKFETFPWIPCPHNPGFQTLNFLSTFAL